MEVKRIEDEDHSGVWRVVPPCDPNWPARKRLEWEAALVRYETGLDVQIKRAVVGGEHLRHATEWWNIECGNSNSGPYTYSDARHTLHGISLGARAQKESG